ncbi:DUF554 domain-containing protein [Staphylospora marina]|uniref:DUF554 domain-containing protein n=1 Tax=Staphylospora marina TaxID=2490858 RepID=UPI001F14B928|nr:DUF554 domain-containing protein [Staphylospora marina]
MLLGTVVNALLILAGTMIGRMFRNLPEHVHRTIMHGIGLVVVLIGLSMALKTEKMLSVLISMAVGGALGSALALEDRLNRFSENMEKRWGGSGGLSTGFVAGTLVFCVGPMAILGSLDSGLRNDHSILLTKSLLDGFASIVFASTMGWGVLFSAVPVFLYQGLMTVGASWITAWIPGDVLEMIIQQVTSTGGLLIMAIGTNLLGITRIRVADFLPALVLTAIAAPWVSF